MNATRRLSIAALIVACTHLVFGAIVRISGSGMGCGDNWPKCYGYWFPPFSRPDLIVEVSHRYLASILTITVLTMALVAFRNRRVAGIGGKGGVLRSALGAVGAVFTAAILGGVTVKMGNAPWATVAHWLVAMTLLAMVATTAVRAGALGGTSSLVQRGTSRAKRSAFAAAVLAIFAVALGGLTAKYPGAAVGCTTVPMCGANPSVEPAGVHIQLTHRTIAVLLLLHLFGMVMMMRKRRASEAPVVVRATYVAFGMVVLQLVVASSMILFHLPPVLRSLHEATGVGIWLSCFVLAYLARRASQVGGGEAAAIAPVPASAAPIMSSPIGSSSVSSSNLGSSGGSGGALGAGGASIAGASIGAAPTKRAHVAEVLAGNSAFVYEPIDEAPILDEFPATERTDSPRTSPNLTPVTNDIAPRIASTEARASETPGVEPASVQAAAIEASSVAQSVATEDGPAARTDGWREGVAVPSVANAPGVAEAVVETEAFAAELITSEPNSPSAHETNISSAETSTLDANIAPETLEAPPVEAKSDAATEIAIPLSIELPNAEPAAEVVAKAATAAVVAPTLTPLPPRPKHTMAVIIARGADL